MAALAQSFQGRQCSVLAESLPLRTDAAGVTARLFDEHADVSVSSDPAEFGALEFCACACGDAVEPGGHRLRALRASGGVPVSRRGAPRTAIGQAFRGECLASNPLVAPVVASPPYCVRGFRLSSRV
jgi:hypothetical protein